MRRFLGFALRVTLLHIVTYLVIGALSYWLIAHRFWSGPQVLPGLRDPNGHFVQTWLLPAQILRGLLYAAVLYPLRARLLELRAWGTIEVAALMLIVGSVAGINGLIEGLVYTTQTSIPLYLAHLPEIVLQSLAFGWLLLRWERRIDSRLLPTAKAATAD